MDDLSPVLVHHIVNTLGWPALRPLQREAVGPVMGGSDALLLAPTAGGKTEAAVFPLLSAMERERWTGLSVLYVCPIKALLNNLLPRLETYCGWVGRRVGLWHGDVTSSRRRALLRDRPDILLTTPESLEAMLVSVNVDHRTVFSGLRAIVVDEVHAFAGDDRGWHLLAVLERLSRVAGRPIQRVGLSATVGNPEELMEWLQGSSRGSRPRAVVAPDVVGTPVLPPPGEIELDYVGSVANAAKVIAALHRGEKRLVFCDSRQLVEELGAALRARDVTTFLSHASLSVDERRRAEEAFASGRDCVIVSTSTLELGIDVGDLDRVIQINAPSSVASFLQRLGRTGRRAGSVRNCLFLALDLDSLVEAAALLLLWGRGYVEPVLAPPEPRHIVAQQVLGLALQENKIGRGLWAQSWNGLAPFDRSAEPIVAHLVNEGFLERDGEFLFIGPEAEARFGRRHFMGMTAVFTAPPEFTVISGRQEIGRTDPMLLTEAVEGPRVLLLAGRSWKVTWIDWKRRRCFVEPSDLRGKARWYSPGLSGASYALTRACREVLLGADPPVSLTRRATAHLAEAREDALPTVHPGGTVVRRTDHDLRWYTWAGFRTNAVLASTLGSLADESQRIDDVWIRLAPETAVGAFRTATSAAHLVLPHVDEEALRGLKFSEALPRRLALTTLATRFADLPHAEAVLEEPVRFLVDR
ncbi:ATP-dependent Lhr-like helicase [Actinocorallia herbida]|uniref:ATP-dependent Lhr-like helicase n=1 Tax=Actinocorallia herbida TaxID=58109 RepID=A0A3N1CQM9_9ACTN|nr:DEAD/DEAH box helicase [Actinocorallia herbida]ROO83038.1 ATP-dependent Lhr-like helicase [Actinocorallia herbida]